MMRLRDFRCDKKPGVHPVMECTQNIPCNPCQDACPKKCIKIGEKITSLPAVDESATCVGCGCAWLHVQVRQFSLLTETYEEGFTMPYEFLPLPKTGDRG